MNKIPESLISLAEEMLVLGCMLNKPANLCIALEQLSDKNFYDPSHRIIFNALNTCYLNSGCADVHVVCAELQKHQLLETARGVPYLITLADYAVNAAYIEEYIRILREKSSRREFYLTSQALQETAVSSTADFRDKIEEGIKKLSAIDLNVDPIVLKPISAWHFLNQKPPEKPELLYIKDGTGKKVVFLHKEIVSMLVAEGGVGKTHFLGLLAMCVASGIPFLTHFEIGNPGPVCFVVGEDNMHDLHRLTWKMHEHLKESCPDLQGNLTALADNFYPFSVHGMNSAFVDRDGRPTQFFTNFLRSLKNQEPDQGWQLIILDPISRFAGLDAEKDNAIATAFVTCAEMLTSNLRGAPTILLSHHKSKAAIHAQVSQAAARGSSALTDGVRFQANLDKNGDDGSCLMHVSKTNFTASQKKIRIKKNYQGIPEFDGWEK